MLQRYLELRLGGETYALGGNVKEIFDTLLGTSSWASQDDRPAARRRDLRGVAVPHAGGGRPRTPSCARSAGASCRTRRATWASLSLPEIVGQATEAEHREMEDFAV